MTQIIDSLHKQLHDPRLMRSHCFIDGEWVMALSSATMITRDPATGHTICEIPSMGADETNAAVNAAHRALPAWRATTATARASILREWQRLIVANKDDLALILTTEQGKPLNEARGEVQIAADYVGWFAEEAVRAFGETIPSPWSDSRLFTIKQPVGVCAAITPWNFPCSMVTRKVAPALAAGCTVVLKPAESTPHSAFALAELARRAGVPAGVFNVVTGNARAIGEEICTNEYVAKLSFTGSTGVGRLLMAQAAPTIKKMSFELGGNAPFIVFNDADLDAAVEGLIISKFRNAGQTCVCANRVFVQHDVYEEFARKLADRVASFQVGAGTTDGTDIGPLIDERALSKVERHVEDAVRQGARVLTGGKRHALGGTYYEPTVLADAKPSMLLFSEETFGPVCPLIGFETEEDVVALANNSEYGLAAYFYSRDIGRVYRVAEALETGMVGVNTGMITTVAVPFGGVKQSGIGREGGAYGLDEYLEVKYVCISSI